MDTWAIVEPENEQHDRINNFLADNIIGYSANGVVNAEQFYRRQAAPLLPTNMAGVPYERIWRAAYDDQGYLLGAITTSLPYEMAIELGQGNMTYARGFLRARRVIEGLAVREDVRGQGLGKALLQENESAAKRQKATLLVGFMDDANGSPVVYKSAGYSVVAHNRPLPPVGEFGLNERHPDYLNGHWFYKVI